MTPDYSNIETALGLGGETASTPKSPPDIVLHIPTEIQSLPLTEELITKHLQYDYESVRKNLQELVKTGKDALDGVLGVAQEGDSPRAYEVVALMIKTLSDSNKDLIELHARMKHIRKVESDIVTNTTTNSIYVGSTRELQNIINSSRSTQKAFDESDIVDSE